ncbi:MAG: hypothetical protein WD273_13925 [Trueperaceae bacterium]
MGGPPNFPFLYESLSLLQRAYDELNSDFESANSRAGIALTAAIAIGGVAVFQGEIFPPEQLEVLWKLWLLLLLVTLGGYSCLAIGAYWFAGALRIGAAPAPYDLDSLQAQAEPVYQSEAAFYFRQIDAHHRAISSRLGIIEKKARLFNQGLILSGLGIIILAAMKGLSYILVILKAYG